MFRLLAISLALLPWLALEGICTIFDWGQPNLHDDPFVGFRAVRPLFVLNGERTRYEIPAARQTYFRPESFPAHKESNEFRIFCLGGSTVQGRPFAIETSFTTWLEISLNSVDPTREWEIVNCGGVSYASYRLVPILEEVLNYEPDLIILCTGHNEFLEDVQFDQVRDRGALINSALIISSEFRSFTLLRDGYRRLQGHSNDSETNGRTILPTEVDALLDYRGGMEEYSRDEQRRRMVCRQFRLNLNRMLRLAHDSGVATVLIHPASNLRDCPPFKSQSRIDLTSDEQRKWKLAIEAARASLRKGGLHLPRAIEEFERACKIDSDHAGTWYNLAKCHELMGHIEQAGDAFIRAKEADICPLRIVEENSRAIVELSKQTNTRLIDWQKLFEERTPTGIVGDDWLLDHVHPSIEGHQLLADKLTAAIIEMGLAHTGNDWQQKTSQAYQTHLDSLDDFYFSKGMERLEGVRGWARGRAERIRQPIRD